MKEIQLTQGKVALVDDDDFEYLNQWVWTLHKNGNTIYARRRQGNFTIYMHRQIIGASDDILVDHINRNGLDNTRINLRCVNHAQNMRNRKIQSNNKSGYRGVNKTRSGLWISRIALNGEQKYLGLFSTPEEAAIAYDNMAKEVFGDFAVTNF